jgi:hypothetical protein
MELQDLRKLIKNIRDKVKSYIHEGKSALLGLVSALSSVETSFQITAYPLGVGVTFSIPIREDKKQNIQDLAKEIKNLKENEIRELINNTKKILDILTDPKLVTKDDIEWVKKVIEEIRYIQENILNEIIKISIDDAIKRAEENISKIISYSGSGLTLLTDSELTDDLAKKEFNDWYEKGYPFGFAAIYHDKDYRRSIVDEVKRKLEENGKAVIVGESGTSKSTIWMRVICEYYKEGYVVLYNKGSKIDYNIAMQYISSLDGNILIAVDNAHIPYTAAVYRLVYENTNKNVNVKYLITIREPDYNRLFRYDPSFKDIDEATRQCIYRFDRELNEIKVETKHFTKDEIREFFQKYNKHLDNSRLDYIFEKTKGHPLLVRFYLTGNGLTEHVKDRHDKYIDNDYNKIRAMLICTLLDLGFRPIDCKEVGKMNISNDVSYLEGATLRHDDGKWQIIHPLWAVEWLSYLFSVSDNHIFRQRIAYLRDVLKDSNEILGESRLYDVISGLIQVLIAGKINIDFLAKDVKIDEYIDTMSNDKKLEIYLQLGIVLSYFLNKDEEAKEYFHEALDIKIDPIDIKALYNKAFAFIMGSVNLTTIVVEYSYELA